MSEPVRCGWCLGSEAYVRYHDEEWGVPVTDDRTLFEFLILEGAQAGLSWSTILNKRAGYGAAYDGFDASLVAEYGEAKIASLLADTGIVRNRAKVAASVVNARAFLAVRAEFGSFAGYAWRFVAGRPIQNGWTDQAEIPARTAESDALSRDLARRGFKFVGSTICYALMQAVGMVNDHVVGCHRHAAVRRLGDRLDDKA